MPDCQCLDVRAPGGTRLTGTAWVRGAMQRLIGEMPDLRRGLRTPEEVPATEALPIIQRLSQTFRKEIDPLTERTTFVLEPPTLVIDGGLTGIARTGGALRALHERARRTVEDAVGAVKRITPLDPHADPAVVDATKAIIKSNLEALVIETQQEPRPFQMDALFQSLLREVIVEGGPARGYLGHLRVVAGIDPRFITRPQDFEQYTRFLMTVDAVGCLNESWNHWRTDEQAGELGMQLVRVTWLFQAVRETVGCYREQLGEACLGDATRSSLPVRFPETQDSDEPVDDVSLEAFLDLVDHEAARWNRMLAEGGTVAVPAIRGFVHRINGLTRRAITDLSKHPAVSDTTARERRTAPRGEHQAPPSQYDILKTERLRAAFDVAKRLGALLQQIEQELQPFDESTYPPAAEQKTL